MTTTEPMPELLEMYFADLDRALIGADARERAETVQAMREHAAEMLSLHGNSEQTAQHIITEFGPVEQVASAVTSAPATAAPAAPVTRTSWVDIFLLAGSVLSLLFFVFPLPAIAVLVWAILRIRQQTGNRALQRAALWISAVSAAFSVVMFTLHWINSL